MWRIKGESKISLLNNNNNYNYNIKSYNYGNY